MTRDALRQANVKFRRGSESLAAPPQAIHSPLVKSLLPALLAIAAIPVAPCGMAVETPSGSLALASQSLDAVRDDEHRARARIQWPTALAESEPADDTEVYLIEGYIDYTCTLFRWKQDHVAARQVRMTRSWFYSRNESYVSREFTVAPEKFRQAWQAAMLVHRASALTDPPPSEPGKWPVVHMSGSAGSHEKSFYAGLQSPGAPPIEYLVRGTRETNGLRDFAELQALAITRIFSELVPPDSECRPAALSEWGPFLTRTVREQAQSPDPFSSISELLLETSLRLLGQMGYAPALPEIGSLETRVPAEAELQTKKESYRAESIRYTADSILTEAYYATVKIALQQQFDAAKARQLIATRQRKLHSDRDLVLWVRQRYFENDPTGYQALLETDLTDPASSPELLQESIASLRASYPNAGAEWVANLLSHANSEVASDAAFALLALKPGDPAAIQTLNRLASDPAATIPDSADWFNHFGRERALDALYSSQSAVPPEHRWDATRVRRQLAVPEEDGRMVNRFLAALSILENKAVPRDEQIAAYRQSLSGKFAPGVECARKALNDLGVKD